MGEPMRPSGQFDVPFRTQQFVLLAAKTGSFRKAAKSLGVDPAVVIRSIDKLERDLGAKIFDRDRNRFVVTKPGGYFIREIQDAVVHIKRARDLARYHAQLEIGPLRIGYSPLIHPSLIAAIERMKQPNRVVGQSSDNAIDKIENGISVECDTTVRLIDRLQSGQLQIALGVSQVLAEDLLVRPVARESFCIAIPRNHRFAKQSSVLVRQLEGETMFFLPRSFHPTFYDQTLEYIESTGTKLVLREILSLAHAMEIAALNWGIVLLLRSSSRLAHPGVLFKPVADKLLWVENVFVTRQGEQDSRITDFRDTVSALRF